MELPLAMGGASQTLLFASSLILAQSEEIPASAADLERLGSLLRTYDEAWASGETANLLALFSVDFPSMEDARNEAKQFLERNRITRCRSRASLAFRSTDTLGAYVDTTMGYLPRIAGREATPFERVLALSHFFLLSPSPEGLQILRMEEYDRELSNVLKTEKLGCPACNFELARPKGWFLVPRGRGWSACTDSLSLIHRSGRISADFDILEATQPVDARQVLELDNRHLALACGTSPEKVFTTSKRSSKLGEEHLVEEAEGGIDQDWGKGAIRTRFLRFYISRGPVLYSLNIYGEEKAFQTHRSEIDALKSSVRILDPAVSLASLRQTMKSRHNPGGILERHHYVNQQYGVKLQGPNGWKAEDYSGPTPFRVIFSCPRDSTLSLTFHAIEDPNGWPDEESIRAVVEAAEKKHARTYSTPPKRVELKRWAHRGLQTFCYEVDWQLPGENPLRERTAFLPAGCLLYVLEFLAPAERFERNLAVYKSALDSLSRF